MNRKTFLAFFAGLFCFLKSDKAQAEKIYSDLSSKRIQSIILGFQRTIITRYDGTEYIVSRNVGEQVWKLNTSWPIPDVGAIGNYV